MFERDYNPEDEMDETRLEQWEREYELARALEHGLSLETEQL